MKAFPENMKYIDSLNIIQDYLNNLNKAPDERDKKYGIMVKPKNINDQGLEFLAGIRDEESQEKIINIFYLIDNDLSYRGTNTNEMFKKINSLLSTGVLFHDYPGIARTLSAQELFVVISGFFSIRLDSDLQLIEVFTDRNLLKAIREKHKETKDTKVFGLKDFFFMIKAQYAKQLNDAEDMGKVDLTNEEYRRSFIDDMILRIKENRLNDGVPNMMQYLERLNKKSLEEGVRL